MAGWSAGMQQMRCPPGPDFGAFAGEKDLVSDSIREEMASRQEFEEARAQAADSRSAADVYENAGSDGPGRRAAMPVVRRSSTGRGESSTMQPQVLFGYNLLQNLRGRPMEDLHVAEIRHIADDQEVGLFAVFDSHCGTEVAAYLQEKLFDNIMSEGGVWSDPAGATRDGYLFTDRQILEGSAPSTGGSSAVTAMVMEHGSRLVVANVGDSRAVLSKDGTAVQLSVDHDPGRPTERANVEMRGGVVTNMPGDVARVDGQLALARAFGDKSLKDHMSAKPDVNDHIIDLSFQFLILGSNGLWFSFSNQGAVDFVKNIQDPLEAATKLVQEARNRGSTDDVTAVVVRFREL